MGILATLGPFIYIHLEKRSKEILYKIEFKRYETLRRFSKTLLLIKELDQLANMIVYRLVKTLRVSYAAIYLYNKEKDAYVLKSFRPPKYYNAPKETTLTKNDALIKLLFIWKKELLREELKNLPIAKQDKNSVNHQLILEEAQNQMFKIYGTLIIPHFLEDELLGFLVLGDKEKGAIYTEEDISILSALSNSAALAIENALFLIDLKITQAELFDTKRIAELGYMASAMGHEINNRLQAIYSAALDMVDNPAIYDFIKQNPQLKSAFDKDISFINENVEDATKIINELKTYARPQDKQKQNFKPIKLEDVIEKAVNVVQLQSVKAFEVIDLTLDAPTSIPTIYGNFIQLQQVFVNLFNNAHDAILEMKDYITRHPELNITNYKARIDVKIEEVKNKLNIHIIDNGMGMTEEIKKRAFIPLYTSKASAERKAGRGIKGGTGIGLYTIQTIMKGHEGNIEICKTEQFKGTDFLIILPIARERELTKKG
jgi:signal transduction histidine kinase